MAKYGELKYGQGKYGSTTTPTPIPGPTTPPTTTPASPPPAPHGSSGSGDILVGIPSLAVALGVNVEPFTAEPLDYGYNLITWTSPRGNKVDTIRLVRNGNGYPTDENDGTVLYSGPVGLNRLEDRDVQQGREYFYSLFIKLNSADILTPSTLLTPDQGLVPGLGSTVFFPIAIARCIAVRAHGGRDLLLSGLPRIYTSPSDAVGEVDTTSDLASYLQLFGMQLDKVKTDLKNMLPFWEASKVPGPLVAPLARTLGQELEFGLGYRQTRILARDSSYIYTRKGTTSGITAFARALTGNGAKAATGPNLMLDGTDASFISGSLGRWSPANSNTLLHIDTATAHASPTPAPRSPGSALPGGFTPVEQTAVGALAVTAASSGAVAVAYAGSSGTDWGVRVQAGATYALSFAVLAGSTGRVVSVTINWLDLDGSALSSKRFASVVTDATSYSTASVQATAPDRATYASFTLTFAGASAGEVHYLDSVQWERLTVPVGDSGMELNDSVNPWALSDPSRTTMSVDGTVKHAGYQSLKLQNSVAGANSYASQAVKVVPGHSYQVSAFAKVSSFTAGATGNRGLFVTDGVATPTPVTSLTSSTSVKILPPSSGSYFGVLPYLYHVPSVESATGLTFDIVPRYADFTNTGDSQWPTAEMKALYDGGTYQGSTITGGRLLHVRWSTQAESPAAGMPATQGGGVYNHPPGFLHAYTYQQILSGDLDTYIDARAAAVAAWGKPMMLTFDYWADTYTGSNDDALAVVRRAATSTGGGHFVQQFADAWRYVKQRFDDAGAANVTWVLMVTGDAPYVLSPFALDDADYDWVAVNGYLKSDDVTVANRWQSYVSRLDNGELGTAARTKPVMIADWGTYNTYAPSMFGQVASALQSGSLGRVKAIVYDDFTADYRFDTSTPLNTAFGTLGGNAYFGSPMNTSTTATVVSGTPNGNYSTVTATTNGFAQQLVAITPVTSSLEVRLYAPQGTVNWDDVSVTRTTPSEFSEAHRQDVFLFADRVNFCTNPNFVSGTATGWSVTPTAPGTSLTGYSGGTTLSVSSGLTVQVASTGVKAGVTTVVTDLTPGVAYTVTAQVNCATNALNNVLIEHDGVPFTPSGVTALSTRLSVVGGGGGTGRSFSLDVSESPNLTDAAFPAEPGKPVTLTTSFIATRNVHTVGFYIPNTRAGGGNFTLTNVLIEASPTPGAYFDGSSGTDYFWEGTAYLSRSHFIRNSAVKSKRLAARMPEMLPVGVPYAVRLAWPGA